MTSRAQAQHLVVFGLLVLMSAASAPSPFYPVFQADIGFSAATLTMIYSFYVVFLLATLLTCGGLSDHVGRRPLLVTAYLVMAVSMFILAVADSVGALLLARGVQGIAGAIGMTTASAAIVDFENPESPGSAAVRNSVTPLIGMAIGGFAAGWTLQYLVNAQQTVFYTLTALALVSALAVLWLPESSPRVSGAWASLRPRFSVPRDVRADYVRGLPALVASWSTGAFFLSLGAPVMVEVLGVTSSTLHGLVVTALMGGGAISSLIGHRHGARRLTLFGTVAIGVGTLASMLALELGSVAGYLVAVFAVGTGFGTSFLGVLQSLLDRANQFERGELFTAIFVTCYIAFSVPALVAGWATGHFGLQSTTLVYGSFVTALGFIAWGLRRFTTTW